MQKVDNGAMDRGKGHQRGISGKELSGREENGVLYVSIREMLLDRVNQLKAKLIKSN